MKAYFLLAIIALSAPLTIIGCGTSPRPTAVPTLAPVVITVVITATPPTITDTPAPPLAPTGTLTSSANILTQTLVAQARPTSTNTAAARATATTVRRTATPTAPKGTATATGIPSIAKYPQAALRLKSPIYAGSDPGDQRDVRQYGADAIVFEWESIGALGAGECFLIRVDTKSQADQSIGGDTFLYCDPDNRGGTQTPTAATAKFTLNKPLTTPGPTYGGITPPGGGDVIISWSVTIARDDGPGAKTDAYYWVDASRHKYTLLSPRSNVVSFILKGAPTP